MKEKRFFRANEVEGKTALNLEEVINIAKDIILKMKGEYELVDSPVLYDINNDKVWYVDIIAALDKVRWPDSFESLLISDNTGEVIGLMNDHGIVHEIKLKKDTN